MENEKVPFAEVCDAIRTIPLRKRLESDLCFALQNLKASKVLIEKRGSLQGRSSFLRMANLRLMMRTVDVQGGLGSTARLN